MIAYAGGGELRVRSFEPGEAWFAFSSALAGKAWVAFKRMQLNTSQLNASNLPGAPRGP